MEKSDNIKNIDIWWLRNWRLDRTGPMGKFLVFFISFFLVNERVLANTIKDLIDANIRASKWLDERADDIDLYLTGRRYTRKANKTQVTLSSETDWNDQGDVASNLNFNLNLRLPNLEEQYHLMFSNYDKDKRHRSSYSRQLRNSQDDSSYGASVGVYKKIKNVKIAFQPRLELRDPLVTAYLGRIENSVDIENHTVGARLELFADSRKGTGEFFSVDYSYRWNPIWTSSFVFEEEYQDGENIFTTLEGFTVSQYLSDRSGMSYSLLFLSDNQPVFHLRDIIVSPSYSHRLFRNVLHYSISISHIFSKNVDFKGAWGFGLNVDLIF